MVRLSLHMRHSVSDGMNPHDSLHANAFVRNYTSTPPQRYPPRFRALIGLIKPYTILISSLNPGGGSTFGGPTIVIPYFASLSQDAWTTQKSPAQDSSGLRIRLLKV